MYMYIYIYECVCVSCHREVKVVARLGSHKRCVFIRYTLIPLRKKMRKNEKNSASRDLSPSHSELHLISVCVRFP